MLSSYQHLQFSLVADFFFSFSGSESAGRPDFSHASILSRSPTFPEYRHNIHDHPRWHSWSSATTSNSSQYSPTSNVVIREVSCSTLIFPATIVWTAMCMELLVLWRYLFDFHFPLYLHVKSSESASQETAWPVSPSKSLKSLKIYLCR
jgi:hypothetical protein